jgi:membrane protein implicated in regulation of membrane protease activity
LEGGVEGYLVWIIGGFVLIIAELTTGTFYLLVLGVGAFAGAAVAWLGGTLFAQSAAAGAVALLGTWIVHRWRKRQKAARDAPGGSLDFGQPVVFEAWIDQAAGVARVRYRGATWDALVEPGGEARPSDVLYITGQHGQTLRVSPARP